MTDGHKITLARVLAARGDVRFSCAACQHTKVVSAMQLAAQHGPETRLDQLEHRARCTRCRSRRIDCRPEYGKAFGQGGMS